MILPAAEQAVADVEAVIVARAALARARQELEAQRHTAITDNADVILAGLHDALTEVVDEVRALEPLDQIGTESAAVASDRTTDMKRLRAVGVTYAKIRAEQIRVLEHHLGGPIGEHSLAAFLARPLDAFPEYAEWMREDRIAPPWPIRGDYSDALGARGIATGRGQVVRDASTEAFLAWAVAADVDLTVPSLDEFQTAAAQLHTAVHADDDERRRELGARPVTATIRI